MICSPARKPPGGDFPCPNMAKTGTEKAGQLVPELEGQVNYSFLTRRLVGRACLSLGYLWQKMTWA